ncbi:MAG: hypothetical protein R3301_12615 [Saprospiraceae bacterium]|nr:hypothetical protein [Saprospiraceae bacterium]
MATETLDPTLPQRILIVGTSCAGKTTLAANIAGRLGIRHFDLDDFHWLPGWQERSRQAFTEQVRQHILPEPQWVVSGNYTSAARQTIWPSARTIIWLDYPLWLVLGRYFRRTFRRIVYREPCCNGNYETLGNAIFRHDNLFFWILRTHYSRRPRYRRWMREGTMRATWIVLRGKHETEAFLARLPHRGRKISA